MSSSGDQQSKGDPTDTLQTNSDSRNENRTDLIRLYENVCVNIRETDKTSFNLLKSVPVVSGLGSGVLALSKNLGSNEVDIQIAIVCLSTLSAIIVFALFKWELRNIAKCNWFIQQAADLESKIWPKTILDSQIIWTKTNERDSPFSGMTKEFVRKAKNLKSVPIKFLSDGNWGKTESTLVIYSVSIVAWMVPLFLASKSLLSGWLIVFLIVFGITIGAAMNSSKK